MRHVAFDDHAITIDGKRRLVLSGAIHYPRSTPEMWPALMDGCREAGLNTVETYVFWNLHEHERGVLDFSGRLDLLHFCELAQARGLDVILRIGPYICAETNYGGLAPWLREIPGLRTRTWNEAFQREMERWVRTLCAYLKPMFAPQGGPIVLTQFENEYRNVAPGYGEDGQRYLRWCVELGNSLNVGVPMVMCSGAAPGALESINGHSAHPMIEAHWKAHPEQPALWTECWTGWNDSWGFEHTTRSPEDLAGTVARFFAAGGTGVNYYMWHGGTNFGRSTMYLQTTSYDYDAPIDEFGLPTTKSRHLARLHRVLDENRHILLDSARPTPEPPEVAGDRKWIYRREADGQSLVFLCNDGGDGRIEWDGRSYQLAPGMMAVMILKNGQVVMDTAVVDPADRVQRIFSPQPQALGPWQYWSEPRPQQRPPGMGPAAISQRPVNQLDLTHDRSDYAWYSTPLEVGDGESGAGELVVQGGGDFLHVFVDGLLIGSTPQPVSEIRDLTEEGPPLWEGRPWFLPALRSLPPHLHDSRDFRHRFRLDLAAGPHRLEVLCCGLGLIKGDWNLGYRNMSLERKGIWGTVTWKGRELGGPWTIQAGLAGEHARAYEAGGPLLPWQTSADSPNAPLRWWRTQFARPNPRPPGGGDGPWALDLAGMVKGIAWINGYCLGRYWLINASMRSPMAHPAMPTSRRGEPTQRYYHVPHGWLADRNSLVLFDETGGDPARVQLLRRR